MTENGFANITKNVFENQVLGTFGKTITRYASTETEDFRGNKTYSFASGTSITGILHRYGKQPDISRDKEGYSEMADGYLMVTVATTVNIGDKIKDPDTNEVFIVKTKKNRRGMYYFFDLYYYEEDS